MSHVPEEALDEEVEDTPTRTHRGAHAVSHSTNTVPCSGLAMELELVEFMLCFVFFLVHFYTANTNFSSQYLHSLSSSWAYRLNPFASLTLRCGSVAQF